MELNTEYRPNAPELRRIQAPEWLLLALILIVVAVLRWRMLEIPFERDEGEYAFGAQLWLQGIIPYVGIYSLKLPGIYLAYAGILAIFGESCRGVHQGLLAVNLLTIVSLFLLARTALDRWGALYAALCYGLLSLSPSVLGFTANAEHFALLPAVTGLWLLRKGGRRPGRRDLFLSGMLLGLAPMIKQHAGVFAVLACGLLIAGMFRGEPDGVSRLLIFVAGGLTPPLVTCAYFAAHGAFPSLWRWTIAYGAEYSFGSGLDWGGAGARFNRAVVPILTGSEAFWIVALLGGVLSLRRLRPHRHLGFLFAFLAAGSLATCPGLHFRPHYFIFLIPAAALVAGLGVDALIQRCSKTPLLGASVAVAVAVASSVQFLHAHATYFGSSPVKILMTAYGNLEGAMYAQISKVSDYLGSNSLPADRVGVMGSEPEIFFYAHRRSATGFVYLYPLFEKQKYAEAMRRQMMSEMEAAPPRFLVLLTKAYTADHYDPAAGREVAAWFSDFRARNYAFRTKMNFYPDRVQRSSEGVPSLVWSAIIFERRT